MKYNSNLLRDISRQQLTLFNNRIGAPNVACSPRMRWIMGSSPGRIKPRNIKLVFAAYQLSIKEKEQRLLTRNQNIVSERRDMFIHGLISMRYHYYNPGKRVGLLQSGHHRQLSKCDLFSSWYNCKIYHLSLNNNHSLTDSECLSIAIL